MLVTALKDKNSPTRLGMESVASTSGKSLLKYTNTLCGREHGSHAQMRNSCPLSKIKVYLKIKNRTLHVKNLNKREKRSVVVLFLLLMDGRVYL